METPPPNPSIRVLIRPPPSTSPVPSPNPPDPSLSTLLPPSKTLPSPHPSPLNGVVVVGFVGRRHSYVTQVINRVIDSNVFGSGCSDRPFRIEKEELGAEVKEWFKCRRISYHHEEEKGILYLQLCSTLCPAMEKFSEAQLGFDSFLEECEFGDLQGILFMFSVCHVIIFIQEGSRFDSQILKSFRVLQAAKLAMAPFVRSQISPSLASRSHSVSSSRVLTSGISSGNPSPGRSGGSLNRNAAITLMSGLGSYTSLFPGQCTPVTLFAFLDDFSDVNPAPNSEEVGENSSINQPSSLNSLARQSLPTKGAGSVVVLARPVIKSEGGFKKKLQSSLEAQIRFLIKKCRTLTGPEASHAGSRSGSFSSSAPLFSLDASKAVILLDRSSNRGGVSLEFATGLVEDVLNGKATSDSLLLESHTQIANEEDMVSLKEFIYRQIDILRGRGGLVANANSGSSGVGMVAVAAAAAAAASAASGKTFTTPQLPSFEIWLSSSQLILHGILSAKRGHVDEPEISKRKSRQRNAAMPPSESIVSRNVDPLELAISYLESGRGLNTKFSTLWCHRALPVAKEVYLNDLPACYPTSQHEAHLERALCSFNSMVKGPAVQHFMKNLEDECTTIWCSGRQLCDAVSLTGKPCTHKRHDVEKKVMLSKEEIKPHSSGFVFLHACACGRSRRLRSDPFDFETANITSNCLLECDKVLPSIQLPQKGGTGPIQSSAWSLIRVGGARYYQPSKGLLQSGFCVAHKFLLKWILFLQNQNSPIDTTVSSVQEASVNGLHDKPEANSVAGDDKKAGYTHLNPVEIHRKVGTRSKPSENIESGEKMINFGRVIPNFKMRKAFSEVVAGTASDSGFPPLQSRKQTSIDAEKITKQTREKDKGPDQVRGASDCQGSQKIGSTTAIHETGKPNEISVNGYTNCNPSLQIGSNLVPVNVNGSERVRCNASSKHVVVYVGFEHECPHGHRFILTPEHLNELGSPYAVPEELKEPSPQENSDYKVGNPLKLVKNGGHGKAHQSSNGMMTTTIRKIKNSEKSKEKVGNGDLSVDGLIEFDKTEKEQNDFPKLEYKNPKAGLQSLSADNSGSAFSLLSQNLPIYMNCPHCKISKNCMDPPNAKFAGTISQLQRILLVTPPLPVILATCPVIQFEASCLPSSISEREQKLQFSLGCWVILPPESFLSLRLPFVYGVQLEDGSLHPLKTFENRPELTAWVNKGTTLQVMSKESNHNGESLS